MSHIHIGPHSRYWQWVYENNPSYFEVKPWEKKGYPVPGNICDRTHRCFMKFEKWIDRPRKSHMLYWRLHK